MRLTDEAEYLPYFRLTFSMRRYVFLSISTYFRSFSLTWFKRDNFQ